MNRLGRVAVFSTLSAALVGGPLLAQGYPNQRNDQRDNHQDQNQSYRNDQRDNHDQTYRNDQRDNHGQSYRNDAERHDAYVRHREWRRGYHMRHDDWDRGQRVDDWRAHHLRRPPRGYEWREVDGNYVMAAVATGIIATVIAANAAH